MDHTSGGLFSLPHFFYTFQSNDCKALKGFTTRALRCPQYGFYIYAYNFEKEEEGKEERRRERRKGGREEKREDRKEGRGGRREEMSVS